MAIAADKEGRVPPNTDIVTSGSARRPLRTRSRAPGYAFAAVLIYAFIDYARPQDVFRVLGLVRPSLITTGLLLASLVYLRVPLKQRRAQLLLALVVFMAIWGPFARNNFHALHSFISMLQVMVFCLALGSFVDTSDRLRKFILMWLTALAFQGIWGITHGGRGTGSIFYDENDLALALTVGLPFTYFLIRQARGMGERLMLVIATGLMLGGIVVTGSRGGFVGILSVAGVLWIMSKHRIRLIVLGAVAAGFLLFVAPPAYWDEMSTITDTGESTAAERIRAWRIAGRVFAANPIFGIGPGNINWHMSSYEVTDPTTKSLGGTATHSLYFTLIPELGLFGILIYICLMVVHVRSLRNVLRLNSRGPHRHKFEYQDACARAVICGTVAHLIGGIFLSVLYYPHLYYLIAMSFAIERIAVMEARRMDAHRTAKPVQTAHCHPRVN